MTAAFWDTSALVLLCVQQQPTPTVRQLLQQHDMAVWWAAPVETRSAFERLLRTDHLAAPEHHAAGARLEKLRRGWRELQPSEALRSQAETLLRHHTLKAADALQLAAAWTWCSGNPQACLFLSGDTQILAAAQQLGFQITAV